MNYGNVNDYELVYLVCDNDEVYNNILFKKYEPLISKISRDFYSRYKLIDLDDLYQEAYLGFYSAINNYNHMGETKFSSFAYLCINNRLNDYVKKVNTYKNSVNKNSISLSYELEEGITFLDVLSSGDNVYGYILEDDFFNNLIHFKNNLSFMQSQIFELKYNGFNNKEICSLLDINIKSLYYHLRSIKCKYKKIDCIF